VFQVFAGFVEVGGHLQVHPEFGGGLQHAGKQNGRLRSHIPLAVDESIHPLDRYSHATCQFDLAHLHGQEELFEEDFSGVRRFTVFGYHTNLIQ
jgi:hypothetical protein